MTDNLCAGANPYTSEAGRYAEAADAYRRAAAHSRQGADLRDAAATLPGGRAEDRDHAGWLRGDASAYDLLALEAEAQAATV